MQYLVSSVPGRVQLIIVGHQEEVPDGDAENDAQEGDGDDGAAAAAKLPRPEAGHDPPTTVEPCHLNWIMKGKSVKYSGENQSCSKGSIF